jgi:ABC-2 type transport system permease protein
MINLVRQQWPNGSCITDSSLFQLTAVRFREFLREPEAVFWIFIFPSLLAAGLGVAFRNSPPEVPKIGTVEPKLAAALASEKSLSVETLDYASSERALQTGRIVLLAISVPGGVVYRYDDTNPQARVARLLAERALLTSARVPNPIKESDQLIRERGSRYIDFVVPGLLGVNLMGSAIWGLVFGIVDARRKRLLRRQLASPMRRWEYLLSFLLSRVCLLLVEVSVFLAFAKFLLGVPIRGRLPELAVLCLLASLAFSALGLLIASRVETIQAASGLTNLVMLPMWILSGVFFSADRFPSALQPLVRALPLTAIIDALRANMLRGETLFAVVSQIGVITGWLIVSSVLALRLFRWK